MNVNSALISFLGSDSSSFNAYRSTFNNATGPQSNLTVHSSPSEYVPPQRVNDAPVDLIGANFTGRLRDLVFLSQVFGAVTEEDVPTRCAVHGMPGLGKTKLLLRFAQIVFARLLYSHIFWMSGATPDKLIEGMTKILDLVGYAERTRSEQSARLTAARLWLESSEQLDGVRWLLILDNVDKSSLGFLHEHLPRRNVKGNILFTTRASDVADALVRVSGACHSTLDLCVPDLVEATHLFFSSAGIDATSVTPMQKIQAEELVQSLGYLPLAIVQSASYMRQTDMTLDNILQVSKSERKIEMIEWESDLAMDQQISVVATFDTLLDQLERDFPDAYNVLRILSFLDPEDIPLAMLTDGARMSSPLLDKPPLGNLPRESTITNQTHDRPSSQHRSQNDCSGHFNPTDLSPELRTLVSLLVSPIAFPKARHKLQSLSLVETLSRNGEPSLRMHDLVHFITREHVKRHAVHKAWLQSAVSLVCRALRRVKNPQSPQLWPEYEKFMPHIRSLSQAWTCVEGVNVELTNADVHLAQYLYNRGRCDDAEKLCERSVGSLRKGLGDKHKDTLFAFYILAQIYERQGRAGDAEEVFEQVLAVDKNEHGPDHECTLATMHELARVYHRQGRHKEAEESYKRVLAVREKKLGLHHPNTLATMHGLARVYNSQERYDEAEELYKNVLALREKHLGPDDVDTLAVTHNLACVHLCQRKDILAEELFTRALVGYEKQFGPYHPCTLTTVAELANLYQFQGRNDEAERFRVRAFTGLKQQLGPNHPDTLRYRSAFASFYRSQGRNSEADALFG